MNLEANVACSGATIGLAFHWCTLRYDVGLTWFTNCLIAFSRLQVVTLSTQAFFLASLLGRQHINPPKDQDVKSHIYGEYYIPVFTLLQFILYMGLLKVRTASATFARIL